MQVKQLSLNSQGASDGFTKIIDSQNEKIKELQLKVAELKSKSSYQRYQEIEQENLLLARENQRLLDLLEAK